MQEEFSAILGPKLWQGRQPDHPPYGIHGIPRRSLQAWLKRSAARASQDGLEGSQSIRADMVLNPLGVPLRYVLRDAQ